MDINTSSIVTAKEASRFYNNDPTGDQANELLKLWKKLSLIEVSEAEDEEQLEYAFLSCPPDSPAEKLSVIRMDEFAKKKR